MAPLPIISGLMRVSFDWRETPGGATAANVMHFHTASTDTLALYNQIASSVSAAMWTGVSSTASIYQLVITPLDGLSATATYSNPTSAVWNGNTSGDWIPQVAGVVSFRTANRGRQYRGRLYLPFIGEGAAQNGVFFGSVAPGQLAWDNFRTAMKTALMPLHIASYGRSLHKHRNPDGSITLTPVTWTPHSTEVIAETFEISLATQRRRQTRLR